MSKASHPSRLAVPGVVVPAQLDYAIRAVVSLARSEDQLTKIDVIATEHGLSAKFLSQVLVTLRNAGLIVTQRGSDGGYRLARAASEITVGEVFATISPGLDPNDTWPNGSAATALTRAAWGRISDVVRGSLDQVTVAELAHVAEPA